jgi:hypothetical protein
MDNMSGPAQQSQTPAGWYPTDDQHDRYWTGTQWSEHVRPRGTVPADQHASRLAGPVAGQPSRPSAKPAWYRRGWVIGVAAFLVGVTLGAASAGSADPTTTEEYQALSQDLDDTRGQLASARDELASIQDELKDVVGDLPAREDAVKDAEAAVEKRESAVADAEAKVRVAGRAVARREKAVGLVETEIANNTVSDGIYEVGTDIKAGTYKTSGAPGCYYAVLSSPDTWDIVTNNNIDGPGILTVSDGQFLEISGCADWVLAR